MIFDKVPRPFNREDQGFSINSAGKSQKNQFDPLSCIIYETMDQDHQT